MWYGVGETSATRNTTIEPQSARYGAANAPPPSRTVCLSHEQFNNPNKTWSHSVFITTPVCSISSVCYRPNILTLNWSGYYNYHLL
jgi:hypothetical protein